MVDTVVCSQFIIKCFQAAQKKNNFLKDRKFGSVLYFVLCSLKFRLLSLESFSIVPGKGLCEDLLTKRFTTMRNLACEREHIFLGIYTSTLVIQCLSHSAVKLSLMKFIWYKYNGSQEKFS
jgi:hypothetical protein